LKNEVEGKDTVVQLGRLRKGDRGLIVHVKSREPGLAERLMSMGILEGCEFEVTHEAPFGKDPIAVRVRGGVIALRRGEANGVEVILHE
jgi:ferrous iron transport protein A